MSVLLSKDGKELIITCKCCCMDTVYFKVDDTDKKDGEYAVMTYLNGNWYRDQEDRFFTGIKKKLKKIWAIIRNKDYYYSDIRMDCEEFEKFKKYINQF